MILFLITNVALHLTLAEAFLKDCPFDKNLSVDDEPVVSVLETFDKDLSFIRVSTESRQDREYGSIAEEMRHVVLSEEGRQPLEQMVRMLQNPNGPDENSIPPRPPVFFSTPDDEDQMMRTTSYYDYFKAEIFRVLGNRHIEVMGIILDAVTTRLHYEGISVNELFKFIGLITIERVSKFNQDVDKLHGLRKGPDYELLRGLHSSLREEIEPLGTIASTESHTILGPGRASEAGPSESVEFTYKRKNPEQDDFKGHSVAKTSIESILCEFAQKLTILGTSSAWSVRTDFTSLVDEMRKIDETFAELFNEIVVRNLEIGNQDVEFNSSPIYGALDEFTERSNLDPNTLNELEKSLGTYVYYFVVEIHVRSSAKCDSLLLVETLLDNIKQTRKLHKGVSLGKILELEGKIVLLSIMCFHRRMSLTYKLDGRESEQELEVKRIQLGGSDTTLPYLHEINRLD